MEPQSENLINLPLEVKPASVALGKLHSLKVPLEEGKGKQLLSILENPKKGQHQKPRYL